MIKAILKELYGKSEKSLILPHSPERAARILSIELKSGTFTRSVIGSVNLDSVTLHYSRPFLRSSFSPQFSGKFIQDGDQTILVGSFFLRPSVQIFMTLWFIIIGIFSVIFLFIGISEGSWAGVVAGLVFMIACWGFAGIGLIFLKYTKRLYQGDDKVISDHIKECFNLS